MERWVALTLKNRLILSLRHHQTLSTKNLLHIPGVHILHLHDHLMDLLGHRLHHAHKLRIFHLLQQVVTDLFQFRLLSFGSRF
ncbi:hypothetical protein [Leptothermofonsia sp. ETS-13]|uniref:hypothetical protein n=1 Tax=Leptothermofonsia sp. ETS-13 TaxID=3035696 RepID=UPI003B9E177E